MRVLLVIPSVLKRGKEADVAADLHPTMDYFALEQALLALGAQVDFLDYTGLESVGGARRDFILAMKAFRRRRDYDSIFTNGENIGLPLALMLKLAPKRPRHVTIGHRISAGKKKAFFTLLKAHRQIDMLFVYASIQYRIGRETLGIPQDRIEHIQFHADDRFFHPMPADGSEERLVCAVGLEWRDYGAMVDAARQLPDTQFRLAAASPWSKHSNATEGMDLPPNVSARRYEYGELRDLYAASRLVVVPLIETDFQAGITTILEAMAMGKPVVVTKTSGQTDVVIDGETGLYVPPGDSSAMKAAIIRLLAESEFAQRLGANGRTWLETHATLSLWADKLAACLTNRAP